MPVVDVLPQLVASPHMRMPAGPIYNGGDATIERDYPHAWRLFLSLRRVNVHHRQQAPLAQLKTALMRAHPDGDAAEAELRLYFECWSRADPEHIVDAARKVMKDDTRTMSMRVLGARALLQFEHPRPYQEVVDFTCANGAYVSMIDDLLRLFPHPNHPNAKIQRDVLRIAPREPDLAPGMRTPSLES
jgi:hypothetical protein